MLPSDNKPANLKESTASNEGNLESDSPEVLVENLYKKNIELLVKNKTLSLLGKLYEISILTLKPKDLANRISQTIQVDLSLELVGIFIFEDESDSLTPLAFSTSGRVSNLLNKLGLSLEGLRITGIADNEFFREAVYLKREAVMNNFEKPWGNLISQVNLKELTSESHVKTSLVYPLIIETRVLGVIMLALNRNYEELNSFERDSINSFINVVALALEKAYLYKKLEDANIKLRELDRQKDAVLHMVAHQLKGPVTTINFVTELLLDGTYGKLSPEQEENISTIRSASKKMGSQSEMVLDAAKITAGKLPLDPKPIDLNELFKEIVTEAETHAKERKVNLKVLLPNYVMPTAILDRKYTQLSIDNLLSNAIKYTALKSEYGNVFFNVEIKNKFLYCTVKDDGIGIPKSEQENIFKELYRATNAGKEGNGLGLHVAIGAIEAQGGKMTFESEENKGTTFYVELPLRLAKST